MKPRRPTAADLKRIAEAGPFSVWSQDHYDIPSPLGLKPTDWTRREELMEAIQRVLNYFAAHPEALGGCIHEIGQTPPNLPTSRRGLTAKRKEKKPARKATRRKRT